MAWECPENPGRLHVNMDTCFLEVLGSDGNPTRAQGQVAVSNLYNCTMPFIRYDLGDRATLVDRSEGLCSCRAPGPMLVELSGNDDDTVVFPDGRRQSPRVLTNAFFNALRHESDSQSIWPNIRRYQLVQEEPHLIRVRIVCSGHIDSAILKRITRAIKQLDPGLTCAVEQVDQVALTPSGKFKKVISNVSG